MRPGNILVSSLVRTDSTWYGETGNAHHVSSMFATSQPIQVKNHIKVSKKVSQNLFKVSQNLKNVFVFFCKSDDFLCIHAFPSPVSNAMHTKCT